MERKTVQRNAIRWVFEKEERPLRIDEILQMGRTQVDGLNQATVYRAINALLKEGWLVRMEHPGVGAVYEKSGKPHHHHFHCRGCQRLIDIPGQCHFHEGDVVPPGFRSESHEIFIYGLCDLCAPTVESKL